ncbi:formyltransferase family protein, partial [Haloarculaceae archaeon H-GB2-1]|nr:formyltransferase family protein [Haloarculaceae archaeon H-GB2-1]
ADPEPTLSNRRMTDYTDTDIVFAGCTEAGLDLCRHVHEEIAPISEIVTLTPEQGEAYGVAGYHDWTSFAETHDVDVFTPNEYAMTGEEDVGHFEERDADLLLVHGWQRLVPGPILRTFEHDALGLHGSAFGLPKGRGRSPMNWSLIEGLDRFLLSTITLDEGADSGEVVATKKFDITDHDTIRTLYYKLVVAAQEMFEDAVPAVLDGTVSYETQTGEPTYYPKRTPEDGAIHWDDPTQQVYDLVRSVSEPYPGAFTEHVGERVLVWEAQPFSSDFFFDAEPGTIVQVFTPDDDFVVKTADGSLLVTDWEADAWTPEIGMTFESLPNDSIDSPNRVDRPDNEDALTTD